MLRSKTARSCVSMVMALWGVSSCLPPGLAKYRNKESDGVGVTASLARGDDQSRALEPALDSLNGATAAAAAAAAQGRSRAAAGGEGRTTGATIYALDQQTYRFHVRENEVWDSAINALMRNYNLTIVDRQSGVLTTEWDSYYLDKDVYRNRLSLRVVRVGRDAVDVMMRNNVERLRDASQATAAIGAVWLPADDRGNEVTRIVQNMALLLHQPPPVLPPQAGSLAKGAPAEGALR